MAKALNKNRIRDTRLILLVSLLATLFTRPLMDFNSVLGDTLSMTGALLIAACALGRVFCTAFLGGHKNTALITHGPFAVCRNPLYVCSLVGVTGVAMLSHHLVLMALVPLAFAGLFNALVRREEELLRTHFGAEYAPGPRAFCRALVSIRCHKICRFDRIYCGLPCVTARCGFSRCPYLP